MSDETMLGMRMHFQCKLVMVQIKLIFVQLSGDIFVFSLQKSLFFSHCLCLLHHIITIHFMDTALSSNYVEVLQGPHK